MARTAIAPDAIRIEEQVWQEGFEEYAARTNSRTPRPRRAPAPAARSAARPPARPSPTPPIRAAASPPEGTPLPGRRTVTIKGRGAERNLPWESGVSPRRSSRLPHHRSTFRPDRLAMWAVFLGLLLVVVAAMSAHA